jgi:hypothetical protein
VFRSPVAVIVWWVWLLFAVGNLIDLAVQGGGHASVVAAGVLIFVTGIVYTTAQVPRVIAGTEDIKVRNPLRDHEIGYGTISKIDTMDLLRIHCEWPEGGQTKNKTFHAWAVQHARRRELTTKTRELRRDRRGLAPSRPDSVAAHRYGGYGSGYASIESSQPAQPTIGTAQYAVQMLNARLEEVRRDELVVKAPVSVWDWRAVAALVGSALILVIAALT